MAIYQVGTSKFEIPDSAPEEVLGKILNDLALAEGEAQSFAAEPRPAPIPEGKDISGDKPHPIHEELAMTLQKLIQQSQQMKEVDWITPEQPSPDAPVDFMEGFMDTLGELEGVEAHKDTGGIQTAPYGVVYTKGLKREEGESDRAFAQRIAEVHRAEINEIVPEFETFPDSVKSAALSMSWNSGRIYPGQKKGLNSGDFKKFAINILDVVTQSEGPDVPPDEVWVIPGLLARRAKEWNMMAEDVGLQPIDQYETKQLESGVRITYYSDGSPIFQHVVPDRKGKKTVIPKSTSEKKFKSGLVALK